MAVSVHTGYLFQNIQSGIVALDLSRLQYIFIATNLEISKALASVLPCSDSINSNLPLI